LLRPLEETAQRLVLLRECASEADQAIDDLRYLFDAEQQKLARFFDEERACFIADAMPELIRRLDERLETAPLRRGPRLRAYAIEQAQDVTAAVVQAWMDKEQPIAESEFAAATERFVGLANGFLDRLAAAGRLPADALPSKLIAQTGLRARSRYYFASFMTLTTPPLWLWVADWFRRSARESAREAGIAFARHLLEANANRVVRDFDERMTESRRSVEAALRRTLQETVSTAEEAEEKAQNPHLSGADRVRSELARLDYLLGEVRKIGT
jgi:hypothetical protein